MQDTEELIIYYTQGHTWMTEVNQFFYLKWNSKKNIIVALPPSSLKISGFYIYPILFFVR